MSGNTEIETRNGELSRAPQRAARMRSDELKEIAANLRKFVEIGFTETYYAERRSKTGKLISKGGTKVEGMPVEEGKRIIIEAERLELLAALTLESMGLPYTTQQRKSDANS